MNAMNFVTLPFVGENIIPSFIRRDVWRYDRHIGRVGFVLSFETLMMDRVESYEYLTNLLRQWAGDIILVLYYNSTETNAATSRIEGLTSTFPKLTVIPYPVTTDRVPVNHLKNLGIQAVKTTHFIVTDINYYPSSNQSMMIMAMMY